MKTLIQFVMAHSTAISLFLAWNFSALLSSMPPLPPNAGWFARLFYDYAQIVAANLNKRPEVKVPTAPPPQ